MTRTLTMLLCLGAACSAPHDSPDPCIATHPVHGPEDLASDAWECAAGDPASEPDPEDCRRPGADETVADCTRAGRPCDAGDLMSRDASMCFARAAGLSEGLTHWRASLLYSEAHAAPVWVVSNTTERDGDCDVRGDQLEFDAVSGELLIELEWSTTCD